MVAAEVAQRITTKLRQGVDQITKSGDIQLAEVYQEIFIQYCKINMDLL